MLISPRLQGANVCLRCELRILRHHRRAPTSRTPTPAIAFSTVSRAEQVQQPKQRVRYDRTYSDDGKGVYKHIHPRGRIRGRRGKEVREETAQLDIESLGKPSEIIVLKDADFDQADEDGELASKDQGASGKELKARVNSQDILKSIEDESNAPAQGAVNANIESLRRDVELLARGQDLELSETQLDGLHSQLTGSYSRQQLRAYLDYFKKQEPTKASESPRPMASGNMATGPMGATDHNEFIARLKPRDASMSRGLNVGLRTGKATLARFIVEKCWKLRLAGQKADVELRMLSPVLRLLQSGPKPTLLDHLSQQRNVTITPCPGQLHVRGTFRARSDVIADLAALLSKVKERCIDLKGLKHWMPDCPPSQLLHFIRSYIIAHLRVSANFAHNPAINEADSSDKSLQEAQLNLVAFNDADLDSVQQALLQYLQPAAAGDVATTCAWSDKTVSVPINTPAGNRLHNACTYFRNVAGKVSAGDASEDDNQGEQKGPPQAILPLSDSSSPLTASLQQLDGAIAAYRQEIDMTEPHSRASSLIWSTSPSQSLSATLGLHLNTELVKDSHHSATESLKANVEHLKSTNVAGATSLPSDSLFVPTAAHIARWMAQSHLTTLAGHADQPRIASQLRFNFIPSPFTEAGSSPVSRHAHISLVFQSDPETDVQKFLHWSAHMGKVDVVLPLPHLAADLKFTKGSHLISTDPGNQQLQDCVTQVQSSITEGGRLQAPAAIDLPFLRNSIPSSDPKSSTGNWGINSWEFDPDKTMNYLYTGVELRQTVELSWNPFTDDISYPVTYIVVDGGRLAGQRTELTIGSPQAIDINATGASAVEGRKNFYNAAVELARQVSMAAQRAKATQASL